MDDGQKQIPSEDWLFEIGSITKVFTSLALADLALENGSSIGLDSPLNELLPNATLPTY